MLSKDLVLLLGGAGAGKSALAQRLAQEAGKEVLFVATAQAGDSEMDQRIRRHQTSRPKHWHVVEEPYDLAQAIERNADGCDVVLVDCLTLWVSNLLLRYEGDPSAGERILEQARGLLESWAQQKRPWFLVSNEVGMGVVPPYPLGRAYRDLLGQVNQAMAAKATRVLLVVAGLALDLKALGAKPLSGGEGTNDI